MSWRTLDYFIKKEERKRLREEAEIKKEEEKNEEEAKVNETDS